MGQNPIQYLTGSRQEKDCTGKDLVQCQLSNIWSLCGDFYFGVINFLISTGYCKCHANIAQIPLTLHKKYSEPTLNKNIRLYGCEKILKICDI